MPTPPTTEELAAALKPKHRRFADEWLINHNGTDAVHRAGYKCNHATAKVRATLLLQRPDVAAYVNAKMAELARKTGITQARVLKELEAQAFSCITNYRINEETGLLELTEGAPPEAMKAVASVKYKTTTHGTGEDAYTVREAEIRLWNKPETLKLAGRHVGTPGFFDKTTVELDTTPSMAKLMLLAAQEEQARHLAANPQPPAVPAQPKKE